MYAQFDFFVIPFCVGMIILPILLFVRYTKWLKKLQGDDVQRIKSSFFTFRTIKALREVFLECLIHRKIFRVNPLLGYMHMSLAFGWFLLIVIGKIETLYYTHNPANELYYPVFFRFFEPAPHRTGLLQFLNAFMDVLLMFILTGLLIAIGKRFYSRITGLKKITKHSTPDRLALTLLWLVFPLRLLAESTTASYVGNGSIITQPFGNFLSLIIPTKEASIVFWWLYSTALGGFLITIPYSRFMHIPTEVILIFLRNYGIKTKEEYSGFSEFELQSCSRCGICIDSCQMNGGKKSGTAQMVYFLRDLRTHQLSPDLSNNCMMCGRCNDVCPVGIDLTQQRLVQRKNESNKLTEDFSYLKDQKVTKADIIYFAGCMSHLNPSITRAMEKIFKAAQLNYLFLDEKGSACCGRPLKLSGQFDAAQKLTESNRKQIIASGAKTLVTSCPICYKSFKEDYHLNIRILHHSEFLPELIRKGKLRVRPATMKTIFHDPCELGRGSGIYEQPRQLLNHLSDLVTVDQEKEKSLCCGGSLANLSIRPGDRDKIQKATADYLNAPHPDVIATACPLCKKSIAQYSRKPVKDIAELMADNLETGKIIIKSKKQQDKKPAMIEF